MSNRMWRFAIEARDGDILHLNAEECAEIKHWPPRIRRSSVARAPGQSKLKNAPYTKRKGVN